MSTDTATHPQTPAVLTERRDGVLCELGPNSALDTSPLIGELLRDAGIAGERCDASAISLMAVSTTGLSVSPATRALAVRLSCRDLPTDWARSV